MNYQQDLISSSEVEQRIKSEVARTSTPEFLKILNTTKEQINAVERYLISHLDVCPVSKLNTFQQKLGNIDPEHLKYLLQENYYNAEFMKTILCATSSIFYSSPSDSGSVGPNQRIRRWIQTLSKIGVPSVEGITFRGSFDTTSDVFVIKTPRNPTIDLRHEMIIGLTLNKLRGRVPNFAYVFGGFMCTQPILSTNPDETSPVGWCNSDDPAVQYIVYESIYPSVSMGSYCKTCTFSQFLSKYLQVLLGLNEAYKTFDYTHNDLHHDNVLIRESSDVYIPYDLDGETIYIKSEGVATIIDYGYSHMRLPEGDIGVTAPKLVAYAIYPNKSFPIYDAFKLLMFCGLDTLQANNMTCFEGISRIIRFFNSSEDIPTFINNMYSNLFSLPYTSKTANVTLIDLIAYIRDVIPEYQEVVTTRVLRNSFILGCMGKTVCISSEDTIKDLGLSSDTRISTVFDFYDIVSKLENLGDNEGISHSLGNFDVSPAYESAINHMNDLINRLNFLQRSLRIMTISDTVTLSDETFVKLYKSYLAKVFEIYDIHQQLGIVTDSLVFLSKYYDIDAEDINLVIDARTKQFVEFQGILNYIKYDNAKLLSVMNPIDISKEFPEISILIKV